MLITRGITEGTIVTLKLKSGEEMVARLSEETSTHWVLEKPRVLVASNNGLAMAPFLFTVDPDQPIPLSKDGVMVILPSNKPTSDSYTQATTSIQMI